MVRNLGFSSDTSPADLPDAMTAPAVANRRPGSPAIGSTRETSWMRARPAARPRGCRDRVAKGKPPQKVRSPLCRVRPLACSRNRAKTHQQCSPENQCEAPQPRPVCSAPPPLRTRRKSYPIIRLLSDISAVGCLAGRNRPCPRPARPARSCQRLRYTRPLDRQRSQLRRPSRHREHSHRLCERLARFHVWVPVEGNRLLPPTPS